MSSIWVCLCWYLSFFPYEPPVIVISLRFTSDLILTPVKTLIPPSISFTRTEGWDLSLTPSGHNSNHGPLLNLILNDYRICSDDHVGFLSWYLTTYTGLNSCFPGTPNGCSVECSIQLISPRIDNCQILLGLYSVEHMCKDVLKMHWIYLSDWIS